MKRTDYRTPEMVRMIREGRTLGQIAEVYGVTRERVRQILAAAGIDERAGHRQRTANHAAKVARAVHDVRGGATIEAAAAAHSLPVSAVRRGAWEAGIRLRAPSTKSSLVAAYLLRSDMSAKQIAEKVGCISCYVHATLRLLRSHGFERSGGDDD